jgi:hypothetical protein
MTREKRDAVLERPGAMVERSSFAVTICSACARKSSGQSSMPRNRMRMGEALPYPA